MINKAGIFCIYHSSFIINEVNIIFHLKGICYDKRKHLAL